MRVREREKVRLTVCFEVREVLQGTAGVCWRRGPAASVWRGGLLALMWEEGESRRMLGWRE